MSYGRRVGPPEVREHLASLVGRRVETITGQPNDIVRLEGDRVFVRTARTRSSAGKPVDVPLLEEGARRLSRDGELRIDPRSVGYRSAFVGAVLGSMPGVQMLRDPARLALSGAGASAARAEAGSDALARWWQGKPDERYWLEVSEREEFGGDLRAPDDRRTSHTLVAEVEPGDVVFHYDKTRHSIIGWSEVVRPARRRAGEYRARLGGMLGFTHVTLERLREFDAQIRALAAEMEGLGYDMRGFPFERSGSRPIRPLPAYLSKLPRRIVTAVPELAEAVTLTSRRVATATGVLAEVGTAYRSANEGVVIPVIESPETAAWRSERAERTQRSTRDHHRLQNQLSRFLNDRGISSLSPTGDDVPFDLAWQLEGTLAFAEIKSLSTSHESSRLRLGLGQCLFYRHALMEKTRKPVAAFVAVPRAPRDEEWPSVCAAVGVKIIWPGRFSEVLGAGS
jgi:hypothetical protein